MKLFSHILALLLAFPASALAALTIDSANISTAQDPSDPLSISRTIATGTTLDAIGCAIDATTTVITSATRSGQSYTLLRRDTPLSGITTEWWYRVNPAVGTANVVLDIPGSTQEIICWGVGFFDSDTSTPFSANTGLCNSDLGTNTAATVTVSPASDEIIIDVIGLSNTGHVFTQGADQTLALDLTEGTSHQAGGSYQLGSAGGVMSWTWTTGATDRCQSVAVVKAIAGGGGGGAGTGTFFRRRAQ